MASLDDFPVSQVRDFLFSLNDRLKAREGKRVVSAEMSVSVEEARMFYAAMKWMELIHIQGITVYQSKIPFKDCLDFIKAKAEALRKQTGDERSLVLNEYGVSALKAIETHIDQLAMMRDDQASKKKRNWKKR